MTGSDSPTKTATIAPPIAEARPKTSVHHGIELTDHYAWLRDDNWQQVMRDPSLLQQDIRSYLEAENAYTKSQLSDTEALQDILFAEMKARIKEDDSSVPSPHGDYAYFHDFVTGGQYPRLCRQPRHGGATTIMLDGNLEAEGKDYWSLGGASHSPDHKLLAYAVDDKGSEFYVTKFRDIATGKELPDEIPDTSGGVVWARDSKTCFYVKRDDNHRPLYVYRHVLGTPASDDILVYEEKDSGFYVGVGDTQSGQFVIIQTQDHQTSEIYVIDAETPTAPMILVAARETGHEYSIDHHGDSFIILTNSGGAEDFRICTAPTAAPQRENWQEMLPHKPGRLILNITAFKDHYARLERENSLPRIVIHRFSDAAEHEIAFDEEAYSLSMSGGYEYDTTALRFTYSSMTTPSQFFDYDMETRARVLRKTQEVPSGHNSSDYATRRILVPARDGEEIPVSLLYHKDTPLDGTAPLLLYGYGSYGISIPAAFSTSRLSLVDRGFIFAIAHVRGGKEKGFRWYTGGKRNTKKNTFTDFIDTGEYLAQSEFTSRGRIVANGGSAGGMLMGGVANMAPDLFLGIIADVPFVDVLNTMLDASLPLTPPEWPEWGNPIESKEDFELILSYCPYSNVTTQNYPHIFALGGLTDPRVTYWEPAKWVAKLRKNKTDDNLLLLKINMGAGHGGASGRFESLKELATNYAFALKIAKMDAVTRTLP